MSENSKDEINQIKKIEMMTAPITDESGIDLSKGKLQKEEYEVKGSLGYRVISQRQQLRTATRNSASVSRNITAIDGEVILADSQLDLV